MEEVGEWEGWGMLEEAEEGRSEKGKDTQTGGTGGLHSLG